MTENEHERSDRFRDFETGDELKLGDEVLTVTVSEEWGILSARDASGQTRSITWETYVFYGGPRWTEFKQR